MADCQCCAQGLWRKPSAQQGKKLTGAVDHWFHGDGGANAELLEDLQAYGATAEDLPAHLKQTTDFDVWPEHVDVLQMFLRVQTQWRTGANGVIGLDYGVVLQLARLMEIHDPVPLLDDLQIMERHARDLLNKAAGQ